MGMSQLTTGVSLKHGDEIVGSNIAFVLREFFFAQFPLVALGCQLFDPLLQRLVSVAVRNLYGLLGCQDAKEWVMGSDTVPMLPRYGNVQKSFSGEMPRAFITCSRWPLPT